MSQFTVSFLESGSGRAIQIKPIGTLLSEAGNIAKFVNFQNLLLVFTLSLSFSGTQFNYIRFVQSSFQLRHLVSSTNKFRSIQQRIVSVIVKKTKASILYDFRIESNW